MKAFILLSLACLAVSLPTYAGTRQADLDLALADPTSLPAPTAATPSNAVLFQKRRVKSLIPILLGDLPSRRRASKTLSKEPSKILSEEPSKDPTSLPAPTAAAPTAATPSNAVLFRRKGPGVIVSILLGYRPRRRYASKTLSKEPSKDPTSLPAPTAATPSNAALFQKRGVGVILGGLLSRHPSWRYASKTLSKEPSKILSKEPSKNPTNLPAPTAATPSNAALFRKRGVGVMLASWFSRLPPRRCASKTLSKELSKTLSEEPSKEPDTEP